MSNNDDWVERVEEKMSRFANAYRLTYSKDKREQSALFEIGCFLALLEDYKNQDFTVKIENTLPAGEYKYLTNPTGNPENWSFVSLEKYGKKWNLRSQIRIRSHIDPSVAFSPDFVVYRDGAQIEGRKDPLFARGQKTYFSLHSSEVEAIHECKSLEGFPELYVSFLGMLVAVCENGIPLAAQRDYALIEGHLASTLFVGGECKALHGRMVSALVGRYMMNIITGIHRGRFELEGKDVRNRIPVVLSPDETEEGSSVVELGEYEWPTPETDSPLNDDVPF